MKYRLGKKPAKYLSVMSFRGSMLVLSLLIGVSSLWLYMHVVASPDIISTLGLGSGKRKNTRTTTATPPAPTPTPPTTAPQPAPAPVMGAASRYGIATGGRLMYMEAPEMDAYLAQVKTLGAGWVRWDIDWAAVQPTSKTQFDWEGVDRAVATSNKYQLQSVAILTSTPEWARPAGCNDVACHPASPDDFAAFARAVAERYKTQGLQVFEIWNEQNSPDYWQPKPDVGVYATLLEKSYGAIKGANPGATVLTGGLAALGDEDNDIAPLTFVSRLYGALPSKPFDGVAVHPYSFPALPSVVAWWNRWQQIVPIRDLLVSHGDSAKKVWITEVGAPTGGPGATYSPAQAVPFQYGADFVSEALQDQIMATALQLYSSYGDWVGPMFWYSLKDSGTARTTPENFYGLLRADGSKKPAYLTLEKAIKGQ